MSSCRFTGPSIIPRVDGKRKMQFEVSAEYLCNCSPLQQSRSIVVAGYNAIDLRLRAVSAGPSEGVQGQSVTKQSAGISKPFGPGQKCCRTPASDAYPRRS